MSSFDLPSTVLFEAFPEDLAGMIGAYSEADEEYLRKIGIPGFWEKLRKGILSGSQDYKRPLRDELLLLNKGYNFLLQMRQGERPVQIYEDVPSFCQLVDFLYHSTEIQIKGGEGPSDTELVSADFIEMRGLRSGKFKDIFGFLFKTFMHLAKIYVSLVKPRLPEDCLRQFESIKRRLETNPEILAYIYQYNDSPVGRNPGFKQFLWYEGRENSVQGCTRCGRPL